MSLIIAINTTNPQFLETVIELENTLFLCILSKLFVLKNPQTLEKIAQRIISTNNSREYF